jgi:hypothetical protein
MYGSTTYCYVMIAMYDYVTFPVRGPVVVKERCVSSRFHPGCSTSLRGYGGLSLGPERAGFEIPAGLDSDLYAATGHAHNLQEERPRFIPSSASQRIVLP